MGLLILVWLAGAAASVVADDDPVLDYYWNEAGRATARHNPNVAGQSYAFTAKSYYMTIGKRGRAEATDSMKADYYFTDGALDSQVVDYGDDGKFKNLDLTSPNIFADEYIRNFYPNDTGGSLAIGFDTDSVGDPRPTGVVLIDRRDYTPDWLYLYYPEKPYHERFTRSFRFTTVDSLVFPDSIWQVGAKQGVLVTEHYRIETGISNIRVGPPGAAGPGE
jgi:hypothetical protein